MKKNYNEEFGQIALELQFQNKFILDNLVDRMNHLVEDEHLYFRFIESFDAYQQLSNLIIESFKQKMRAEIESIVHKKYQCDLLGIKHDNRNH